MFGLLCKCCELTPKEDYDNFQTELKIDKMLNRGRKKKKENKKQNSQPNLNNILDNNRIPSNQRNKGLNFYNTNNTNKTNKTNNTLNQLNANHNKNNINNQNSNMQINMNINQNNKLTNDNLTESNLNTTNLNNKSHIALHNDVLNTNNNLNTNNYKNNKDPHIIDILDIDPNMDIGLHIDENNNDNNNQVYNKNDTSTIINKSELFNDDNERFYGYVDNFDEVFINTAQTQNSFLIPNEKECYIDFNTNNSIDELDNPINYPTNTNNNNTESLDKPIKLERRYVRDDEINMRFTKRGILTCLNEQYSKKSMNMNLIYNSEDINNGNRNGSNINISGNIKIY